MSKYSPAGKSEQLLRLSDQVNRVAQSLAELATENGSADANVQKAHEWEVSEQAVAGLIRSRMERSRYLGTDLFTDPVWDILLFLLHAEIENHAVSISSASMASGLPKTVARRWLDTMVEHRLIAVQGHPNPSQDDEVELTPEASRSMRRYFIEVVAKQ